MSSTIDPGTTLKTAETLGIIDPPQAVDANGKHVTEERVKLPAEVLFDKSVYGGISYFAQAATGVVLTNWLTHGGGRRHFVKAAEWLGPNFMKLVSNKKGAAAIEEATGTIIVSTMIMVGNTFLLPVKWLENRKPQIVRGMTERSNARREAGGETISPEELAAQQKSLDALEKAPKQTWWSLLGGRAFGLAAVYGVLWGMGNRNNKILEEGTYKGVAGTLDAMGAKKLAKSKTLENYTRIAFYDMFYSTVSASGLYVYSHFIMPPKKGHKTNPREEVLQPLEEAVLEELEAPQRPAKHRLESVPSTTVTPVQQAQEESWKNRQQTALQARAHKASSHVDGITQQPDAPLTELAV